MEARWPGLLSRIITARVPLERFAEGIQRSPGDVKTVIEVASVTDGRPGGVRAQ